MITPDRGQKSLSVDELAGMFGDPGSGDALVQRDVDVSCVENSPAREKNPWEANSKEPPLPLAFSSQPKRAEASRRARGAWRHPGRIDAMPSNGTPKMTMSESMAVMSKTYGALQNVAIPVCGSEAEGRALNIAVGSLREFGSNFQNQPPATSPGNAGRHRVPSLSSARGESAPLEEPASKNHAHNAYI